jgi:YfiH family protein
MRCFGLGATLSPPFSYVAPDTAFQPHNAQRLNRMNSFLHFSSFSHIDGLQHAITTRHGGSSERFYASLNLGFHVGDKLGNVCENRQTIARNLGYNAENLTCAQQTHGANIEIVTRKNRGRGALDWQSAIPSTDALMTQESDTPLMILVADCAPLLLVDEVNHVVAVVHAGWRGATSRIASQTVLKMTEVFGTKAEDLRVGIGPTLCVNCFEVGEEVVSAATKIAPQSVLHDFAKPHLDLRELLREDLRSVRVLDSQIETLASCPRCETQDFFSHRGENGTTGRFGLIAWWK